MTFLTSVPLIILSSVLMVILKKKKKKKKKLANLAKALGFFSANSLRLSPMANWRMASVSLAFTIIRRSTIGHGHGSSSTRTGGMKI